MNGRVAEKAPVALIVGALLLSAGVVVGATAYVRQLMQGDAVTALGTLGGGGVVWGLYIVMDGVFLGGGVAIMACACVARFSRDRDMAAVARIAMPSALVCFLAAALSVLADQGRPAAALVHLAYYARPQSPLFVTFTGVGAICLFASLVHWLLARRPDVAAYAERPSFWRPLRRWLAAGYRGTDGERRRRQQVSFWMSLLMLPALAIPLAALAALFTVRPGRPLAVAVAEAIAFVLSSGVVGLALLAVAAAAVGWWGGPRAGLRPHGFMRLGRALLLADALAVLMVVVTQLVALQANDPAGVAGAEALLRAPYGGLFWTEIGLFLAAGFLLWGQAARGGPRPRWTVVASVLAATAAFLHRYTTLVAWQTHGLPLPYAPGGYVPSGIEMAVETGIVSLALLVLLVGIRLIPFAPAMDDDERPGPAVPADARRRFVTALWGGVGVVLAAAGLALSLRLGTESFLDPVFPGSPVLFMAGLMVLATTGAVYELLPEPGGKPAGAPSAAGGGSGPAAPPPR
jgi:Ni/Fe-hydrogenase subunit HybB-like protein